MTTYQKFKKLNIRHSAIGLEQSDTDVTYYCTPRDAAIIGWAGVDGIHYCTIPEFGEMIFAVSPMNFGDCVHPIAHSFEDLLRLLLSCGSMDALEQCYAWDEEQFKAFLIDCPATEEQQSVLDVLRTEFRLVPLEDAFAYVKKLQAEFDLSQIPYTEEYYDPDMNAAAPVRAEEWIVTYDGGFWRNEGNAGIEIPIQKSFCWGEEKWYIPAVYICDKGLVIDYVEVENVEIRISDESAPNRITFKAEVLEIHEGYFLVAPEASWALNSADQIEVPLMNMDPALEPQIGDIIEVSYSGEILETYPARLKEVYSIRVVAETTKLTLDDVIILSQYGYDLSWSDFENYDYIETGSGLYIRVYVINEMYELWIGGGSPDSDPMYIYLALADDLDTRIDIRDGGVTEFIGADHSEVLLAKAINEAILAENKPSKPDGLYHCASFVLLDQQELSGTPAVGSSDHIKLVTVYGLALHQGFGYSGGTFHDAAGSHIAVAITFEVVDGKYVLKEYWTPRDGSYYVQDIRDKFPDEIEDEALDTQKYILAQKQDCYDQGVRYGGVDTYSAVEYLFEVIESSPATSSRPADYIDAHPIEYRELTYYGSYTLQYVFSQFLEGGQTGLRGHLMRSVLDDLAPEAQLRLYAETGQEYFDEWKAGAIRISEQHDMEWIKENQPAIWLLLQMIDE